ncbi:hypothetical protein AgCh_008381 [Apium graveolens]
MITPISSDLPPVIDNTSADSPTSTSSDIFIPYTTSDIIPLRRTSRVSQLPKKFDNFVLPTGKSTSLASPVTSHIFNVFSEPSLSHLDHHNLTSLNSVLNTSEPSSYKQAKEGPRWVEAMQKEIAALEANETWDLTPLPLGGHVIGSKWVFKTKFNPETGFRQWNIELTKFLIDMGYSQSTQDYSLFVKQQDTSFTAIICYVDDLLLTGNDFDAIQSIKSDLHKAFTIKDLGDLKYFLGVKVSRDASGIRLNQRKYILYLLKDTNMLNCTPVVFPLSKGLQLSIDDTPTLSDPEIYRRLVGKLLYLNLTRPDISYVVQQLFQFLSAPAQSHLNAAQHVLRYLKGTLNVGLFYKANISLELIAYCDTDWGTCPFSARSLSGYAIFLGSSLISSKTKKQKTVSKSTAEAEYRSMSYTTSELVWLEGLFIDLKISIPTPINLYCDNIAAKYIAEHQIFQERTKHLHMDCHFVRDFVNSGFIKIFHIRTFLQLADIMTKPLSAGQHKELSLKLGLLFSHCKDGSFRILKIQKDDDDDQVQRQGSSSKETVHRLVGHLTLTPNDGTSGNIKLPVEVKFNVRKQQKRRPGLSTSIRQT